MTHKLLLSNLSIVVTSILFSGCQEEKPSGEFLTANNSVITTDKPTTDSSLTTNSASAKNIDYWGEWESTTDSSQVYITSQTTTVIEQVEDNLIKIDGKYYIRSSEKNVSFLGSVYYADNIQTTSIENIPIVLTNIKDKNIKQSMKSDQNGTFKGSSLPVGKYILAITDNNRTIEANVSLVTNGQNIGAFQLSPVGVANFQTTFDTSAEFFYSDHNSTYNGNIIIKNIGSAVGTNLTFETTLEDAKSFKPTSSALSKSSLAINSETIIPVSFSFDSQLENEKNYILKVKILDGSNRIWQNNINLTVYKMSFEFVLQSNINLTGTIKAPNGKIINLNGKTGSVTLPSLSADKSYTVAIMNYNDVVQEGAYGFSTSGNAISATDLSSFSDKYKHEPNDKLSYLTSSTKMGSDNIISYAKHNDTDYFQLYSPQINKTAEELKNKAPTMKLSAPTSAPKDSNVSFSFVGSFDDVAIVKYELNSSIDKNLYSGLKTNFSTSSLSDGNHTIYLYGYDKWGASGFAKTNLLIKNSTELETETNLTIKPILKFNYIEDNDTIEFGFLKDENNSDEVVKFELNSSIDGLLYSGADSNFSISSLNLSDGNHTIVLKTYTASGLVGTTTIELIIQNTKTLIAKLKMPTTMRIDENATFEFNGSISKSDAKITQYELVSNIDQLLYVGSDKVFTSKLSEGNHTIILTITDQNNNTDADFGYLLVSNEKPIAVLKTSLPDIFTPNVGTELTFDFSESKDNVEVVRYELYSSIDGKIYDGNASLGNRLKINSLSEGNHTIILRAFDENNLSSDANLSVIIANDTPLALLSLSSYYAYDDEDLMFFYEGSSDRTGISQYKLYSNIDGLLNTTELKKPIIAGANGLISIATSTIAPDYSVGGDSIKDTETYFALSPLGELLSDGNHTITLKACDQWNKCGETNASLTVKKNKAPIPVLDISNLDGNTTFTTKSKIKISGEKSTDPDIEGKIKQYLISSSIDGLLLNAELNGSLETNLSKGDHTITLTVTDDREKNASITKKISVVYPTPTVVLDSNFTSVDRNQTAVFIATSNLEEATFVWSINKVKQSETSNIFKHSFLTTGDHNISVVSVANEINSASASLLIYVRPYLRTRDVNLSVLFKTGQEKAKTLNDDGTYQKGVERQYTRDDSLEIVNDLVTKLMWEDGNPYQSDWVNAMNYCDNLYFGGYYDWRVPTRKELLTLIQFGRNAPAIDPMFQNTVSDWYWTSIAGKNANDTGMSWGVNFGYSMSDDINQSENFYIRCVR